MENEINSGATDRKYWTELLYRIAKPVLCNMSAGNLRKNMPVEYSPVWDGRSKPVACMGALGRLMAGLSPWLALPEEDTAEGILRSRLLDWALKSFEHAVNPKSPDYLEWHREAQPLVDAAYLVNAFLRAPEALWQPLPKTTKQAFIRELKGLRRVKPFDSNWLLFGAMIETFLLSIGEEYNENRIVTALQRIEEWYVGDGWYSDGRNATDVFDRE